MLSAIKEIRRDRHLFRKTPKMSRGYVRVHLLASEEKAIRKADRTLVRDIAEAFQLPENEYLRNYKVSKEMILYLCNELDAELSPRSPEGYPVLLKVLSSLKILLDGHYQRGNGNEGNHCIAQTTVSKYLQQFVTAVNARLKPEWILFPGTPEARNMVAHAYHQKCGVPHILGAIDCTQVKIFPPPGFTNQQYRNRHGEMSINVQLVSDCEARILNVNANYPGRCHDQFIFNNSAIKAEMSRLYNQRIGQYILLGDAGYALEPWLMTPIGGADPNSPEGRYTSWHCSTRNVIERTNGYLKGTFRCLCLDRRLHYDPKKASDIIYTCCTLYNIMKHFRVPLTVAEVGEPAEELPFLPTGAPAAEGNSRLLQIGQQRRQHIVQTYF